MAKNLKEAFVKHQLAAAELDRALRDCLKEIQQRPDVVVEGRFRLVQGGKTGQHAKM